jgi:hypothetical protein
MKLRIPEKPPAENPDLPDGPGEGNAEDNFDAYARLGDRSQANEIYRSLGEPRRVPAQTNGALEPEDGDYLELSETTEGPMTAQRNVAFEPDGRVYLEVLAERAERSRNSDPQGRLEDGYKGEGMEEAPIYLVLDPDAVDRDGGEDPSSRFDLAAPSLYAMEDRRKAGSLEEEGAPSLYALAGNGPSKGSIQGGYTLAGGSSKNPNTDDTLDYDYSHPYSKPPIQKPGPGTKMAANHVLPGNDEDDSVNQS